MPHIKKSGLHFVHTRSHIFHFMRCIRYTFCLMHTTELFFLPWPLPFNSKAELFFRHIQRYALNEILKKSKKVRDREQKMIKTAITTKKCQMETWIVCDCNASKNIMLCRLVERAKFIRLVQTYLEMHDTHSHARFFQHTLTINPSKAIS